MTKEEAESMLGKTVFRLTDGGVAEVRIAAIKQHGHKKYDYQLRDENGQTLPIHTYSTRLEALKARSALLASSIRDTRRELDDLKDKLETDKERLKLVNAEIEQVTQSTDASHSTNYQETTR